MVGAPGGDSTRRRVSADWLWTGSGSGSLSEAALCASPSLLTMNHIRSHWLGIWMGVFMSVVIGRVLYVGDDPFGRQQYECKKVEVDFGLKDIG